MLTVGELRERLIEKATTDEAFRARLLADPRAAIKGGMGLEIPAGFNIVVHEDVEDTSHVVLPPLARLGDAELAQVAAGAEMHSIWGLAED